MLSPLSPRSRTARDSRTRIKVVRSVSRKNSPAPSIEARLTITRSGLVTARLPQTEHASGDNKQSLDRLPCAGTSSSKNCGTGLPLSRAGTSQGPPSVQTLAAASVFTKSVHEPCHATSPNSPTTLPTRGPSSVPGGAIEPRGSKGITSRRRSLNSSQLTGHCRSYAREFFRVERLADGYATPVLAHVAPHAWQLTPGSPQVCLASTRPLNSSSGNTSNSFTRASLGGRWSTQANLVQHLQQLIEDFVFGGIGVLRDELSPCGIPLSTRARSLP
jgi:hypothetical protein